MNTSIKYSNDYEEWERAMRSSLASPHEDLAAPAESYIHPDTDLSGVPDKCIPALALGFYRACTQTLVAYGEWRRECMRAGLKEGQLLHPVERSMRAGVLDWLCGHPDFDDCTARELAAALHCNRNKINEFLQLMKKQKLYIP